MRGGVLGEGEYVVEPGRRNGRLKPRRLRNAPVSHISSVTEAGDSEPFGIDPGVMRDRVMESTHEVLEVAAAPIVHATVGKHLPVSRTAARINIKDAVPAARLRLIRQIEVVAIHAMWSAVYGQDKRIFLVRRSLQRRNEPALYVGLIKAVEPECLRRWQLPILVKLRV